ncbi:MAG: hypothetical protein ACO1N9_14530 [Flavobacterium sp.]
MVLGSFYFRQTANGNLVGEFANNESKRLASESADSIEIGNIGFIGQYTSTWYGESSAHTCILSIRSKADSYNLLILEWRDAQSNLIFRGEGFINNNILIGTYWDNELHRHLIPHLGLSAHISQ